MHSRQWSPWWAQPTVCRWLLWLLLITLAQGSVAAAGQTRDAASQGTIAYVRPDGTQGDQIRLIEPDGTGDRVLWRTAIPRHVRGSTKA